jgi:signal transduction histidine kinase
MERILHIQKLLLRSRRLPWLVLGITLLILGGIILLTTHQTRGRIRAQIIGRDREILHAVARMQMPKAAEADEGMGSLEDPANQLAVIMEISKLSGVMGARLFDAQGHFVESVPGDLTETTVSGPELAWLHAGRPVSQFYASLPWSQLFLPDATKSPEQRESPVLEVAVPLQETREQRLVGIAQFVIEGYSIAQEFARLDRHLWRQALTAFAAGALILAAAITWSFRRLNHAHRLLAERTEHLLKANQELALTAKTSAVGAVTSHLIHGLRNPLAGLQSFVAGLGASLADHPGTDLQQAMAATRRMQAMINEVIAVLREEEGTGQYEIPLQELVELISAKAQTLCRERGVRLTTAMQAQAILGNRAANLVALILANLVQNAVEATPSGGEVALHLQADGESLRCEVHDQGAGFPEGRSPFVPCSSQKEGGSGIGLAISKQLANHLGAGLELHLSSPRGCVFRLQLPASLWKPKTSSITLTLG